MGLEKLKHLIKVRGLTVDKVADLSGIPASTINKIIGGHSNNPTFKTITAISHTLSLTVDELIDLLDLDVEYKTDNSEILEKFNRLSNRSKAMIEHLIDYELAVENEETKRKKDLEEKRKDLKSKKIDYKTFQTYLDLYQSFYLNLFENINQLDKTLLFIGTPNKEEDNEIYLAAASGSKGMNDEQLEKINEDIDDILSEDD